MGILFANRAILATCTILLIVLAGCGYRFQTEHGVRFAEPRLRFDLRSFSNNSLVPDAGAFLAARLREELRHLGFRGTFERSGADYQIEGRVREIREEVSSHGGDGFALEHRLTLLVDIRVLEVTKGRLVWKEEGLTEAASYFSGADFQYTESNRRMAFEEVCRRMARKIGQTIRVVL
ncbi:MAG: hypothetical protein HZA60_09930 [Deltaproteobacteria bacterium]|nr:hypothetical protein [Deltaproteobacteria bacterium]